jgi:hypothetical protein
MVTVRNFEITPENNYRIQNLFLKISRIINVKYFFFWYVGEWSPVGSTRHYGHQRPIVPAPGDYDDGEIGGMIGRGNRSTRRKPAPNAALATTFSECQCSGFLLCRYVKGRVVPRMRLTLQGRICDVISTVTLHM